MTRTLPAILIALSLPLSLHGKEVEKKQPVIELAILLDTSSSMDGLIEQAKSQLWKIVNEFALVKRDGQRPLLHVALIEYGNNRLNGDEQFVRLVVPLSDDLDKISAELFALKATQVGGSEERCGAAIKAAIDRLQWSRNNADLKLIYIAGNETFTLGDIDWREACKGAITKGVQVNTIFCGNSAEGIALSWKDGAMLADGSYMSIDHNVRIVEVSAPQDKELAELGGKLNGTYVPYGRSGRDGAAEQVKQDANAGGVSTAVAAQRAFTKSTANYRNSAWCLVDGVYLNEMKVEDLKDEDLPEHMRKMTLKERKEYLAAKKAEREAIQKRIGELSADRAKHVADETKKQTQEGAQTLDEAVIKSLREQAEKKDYRFEK